MALFKQKQMEWIWPSIVDIESAQKASKQGAWAATWVAGTTLVLVAISSAGSQVIDFDLWSIVPAFLFIIIGWGIFKMNKIASATGLALFIVGKAVMWVENGAQSPVMAIFFALMFTNSVRGTYAYHKLAKIKKELDSDQASKKDVPNVSSINNTIEANNHSKIESKLPNPDESINNNLPINSTDNSQSENDLITFNCPECKLGGNVNKDKIPNSGIYATCPKCTTKFIVYRY